MKTVCFFETSNSLNPATRRHISEASNLKLNAVGTSIIRILPISGPHSEGQTKAQCFRTWNFFYCLAIQCPSVGQKNWAAPEELLVMLMEFHIERFSWAEIKSELDALKFWSFTSPNRWRWRDALHLISTDKGGRGWGVRGFCPCLRCTDVGVLSVATSDSRLLPTAFQFAVNQMPSVSTPFTPSVLTMTVDN